MVLQDLRCVVVLGGFILLQRADLCHSLHTLAGSGGAE
jgi:hypothetical protein